MTKAGELLLGVREGWDDKKYDVPGWAGAQ